MSDPAHDDTQRRVDRVAGWYRSREDFDAQLIAFGWRKIARRAVGTSALELGSAEGLMTEKLWERFARVVVVEGAAQNVASLRERLPRVEVRACLFEDFETDERFDNVIAARVLEHVDDPVLLLKRCRGWLAPGGRIHVVVPNADSLNRRLGLHMGMLSRVDELSPRDQSLGHVRVYRADVLLDHVRQAELDVVELAGTFLKPLANAQMTGLPSEVLEGFFRLSDELPALSTELYAVCEVPAPPP